MIKKLYKAIIDSEGLVPECSYCAAMRFALVSSTLTGVIFGIGSSKFFAYLLIGAWIGIIQVVFLYGHYHATHEGEESQEKEEPMIPYWRFKEVNDKYKELKAKERVGE